MSYLTIGITGGIGAGKSVVSRVLRCNGFKVYDCDTEAKILMNKNREIKNSLQSELGEDIYFKDGTLNRKKLASLLFSNGKIRKVVNKIVHTAIRMDILNKKEGNKQFFFIESAILATSHLDKECDKIWLIIAPLNERIRRVGKRDSIEEREILQRIESQKEELSLLDKNKMLTIENDNQPPLLPKILKLTDKLINNQIFTILC